MEIRKNPESNLTNLVLNDIDVIDHEICLLKNINS